MVVKEPSGAFYARAESELCVVRGPGCLEEPYVRISCETEGSSTILCHVCYAQWRARVSSSPSLVLRCPRCADLEAARVPAAVRAAPVPLTGQAARAIDAALHAEGITIDIRRRVLIRLRTEAPWLGYAHPDAIDKADAS